MSILRQYTLRTLPLLLASSALTLPLITVADTIILTSGDKFDCTVLEETASYIEVEFDVTATIKDRKRIPIEEVVKVIKLPADQVDFAKIQKLLPTPDLLQIQAYDDLIDNHVRVFLTTHPNSPLLEEVSTILGSLNQEREKVLSGGAKFEGKWLTAQQLQQEQYNIESKQLLAEAKAATEKGDVAKSFRALGKIEESYSGSLQYPAAIEAILSGVPKFTRNLEKLAAQQPFLREKRRKDLASLIPGPDRTKATDAINKEIIHHETLRATELENGIQWRTIYEFDLVSITEAQDLLAEESERLNAIDTDGLIAGAALATKANEAIAVSDFNSATKLIDQARTQGGDETYLAQLEGDIADLRAKQEMEATAAANAQTLEQEKNAALATLAAVKSREQEAAPSEEVVESPETEEEIAEEPEKAPAPRATPTVAAPEESGGGIPFRIIIVGIGLIFLLVTGVAKFLQKKKNSDDDGEE